MQDYLRHHGSNGAALVRAAREYCDCAREFESQFGPPTSEQVCLADKYAESAIALLRQAVAADLAGAKKEYRPVQFLKLQDRDDYRRLAEKFRDDF
jgi:hypothetical protein